MGFLYFVLAKPSGSTPYLEDLHSDCPPFSFSYCHLPVCQFFISSSLPSLFFFSRYSLWLVIPLPSHWFRSQEKDQEKHLVLAMSEHHQDSSAAAAVAPVPQPQPPQPHVQDPQHQHHHHHHHHHQQQQPQYVTTTAADTPATTQPTAPSPSSVAATAAAATAAVNQSQAAAAAARQGEELSCLWQGCTEKCPTAETLYVGFLPY